MTVSRKKVTVSKNVKNIPGVYQHRLVGADIGGKIIKKMVIQMPIEREGRQAC